MDDKADRKDFSRDEIEDIASRARLLLTQDDIDELREIVQGLVPLLELVDRTELDPSDDPFAFSHVLKALEGLDG